MDESRKKLGVLFNYDYDETCQWRNVRFRVLPPACLPKDLSHVGSAFEVMDNDEWLLRGAVRSGVDLKVPKLKMICTSLGVALPGPKQGSGKRGNLKRQDFVQSLIKHLWPDCTDEFSKATYNVMMKTTKQEHVDLNVLAMVSELDCENQESFQKLKAHAMDELEAKVFGKGKLAGLESGLLDEEKKQALLKQGEAKAAKLKKMAATKEDAEHMRQWRLTPPELRALLPGNGAIAGVFWMRYHPINHWWRITYPTSSPFFVKSI